MKSLVVCLLASFLFSSSLFAQQYLGVGYGPYVGEWSGTPPNANVPLFNSYTQGQVRSMLTTISTKFKFIATYSAGYASYYSPTQPWNQVDSNWRVGPAAASVNKAKGKKSLDVAQGIFQQSNPELMRAEILGAFKIARNANTTFPNTVTKLIFTNEYVTNAATTTEVTGYLKQYRTKARLAGLKIGVRSNTFGQLNDPESPYLSQMRELVRNCDFIMCNIYPSRQQSAAAAVDEVAAQFLAIRKEALRLNPKIQVMIGETGWPSQGISFNQTTNTVANERAFFRAIRAWANRRQVITYFFEAVDEPWKSNQNSGDPNSFQGPNGGEGHYGLWTATKSGKFYTLTPKFSLD